jgi:hypothetical protein
MPLTFLQENANEKENCRNIFACDSTKNANIVINPIMLQVSIVTNIIVTNPTTLQVSSIAKVISDMHAIVSQLTTMNPCVVLGDLLMNLPSTLGVDEKNYGFFENMTTYQIKIYNIVDLIKIPNTRQ